MTVKKITTRAVDALALAPSKTVDFLWDTETRGFGVMVLKSGKKIYCVQYSRSGRISRIVIGQHGTITTSQARAEAQKLLLQVATGSDPLAAKKAASELPKLFGDAAEAWFRDHVATKRKGRTAKEYRRILDRHVLPAIGKKGMGEVSRADVSKLHAKMCDTPFEANRALKVVSAIWNWSDAPLDQNPCRKVERFHEEPRDRFLSMEELGRLGDALATVTIDPYACAAIKLLLLTGARLREILDAKWENVDFERSILFLQDSKTGKKPIYLGAAALVVLANIERVEDNPHVIVGHKRGQPRADLHSPWRLVTVSAGLEGVCLHTLRHTAASIGAGAGLGLPMIGRILGHKNTATTQRYAHLDAGPMHIAVNAIGAQIEAAMSRNSAEIVPMRRAK